MATNNLVEGRLSFNLLTSRVIRLWLISGLVLTLISFILIFFLPKAGAVLLLVVLAEALLTAVAGVFIYFRYRSNPAVKDKQAYLTRKRKLGKDLLDIESKLKKIEEGLASSQAGENLEIENAVQKIQKAFIENGLKAATIDGGEISGIGPKLKEKLKANGVNNAAGVGPHLTNLEGFGTSKVQALINWKESVLSQLEATKPGKLPDPQENEIRKKHKQQRDSLIADREQLQSEHTKLDIEFSAVAGQLKRFADVNIINFFNINLLGDKKIDLLKKHGNIILPGFLLLGVALFLGLCAVSGGAMVASVPTLTPTITLTATLEPTFTAMPSETPTATFTPTITPTSTFTPTLAYTPTLAVSPTATQLSYYIAECLPRNTTVQKGTVVEIIDGDTVDVRLEDGTVARVRYIGIDTPERERPLYEEARKLNSDLVLNKEVILIKDVSETDPFDRLLRYVVVGDVFVNMEMVKQGLAVAEDYPPDSACSPTLSTMMVNTRSSQIGLWEATTTPEPSAPVVVIVSVNKRAEYVDIQNKGASDVDLSGWNLVSETGNQGCYLSGILKAGETLRIWSMAGDGTGFSCGYGSDIWNNSKSDPAVLYNAEGVEVSRN